MLSCPACMRRCLRTAIGDLPQISISPRRTLGPSSSGKALSARTYTSFANENFKADSSPNSKKIRDVSTSTSTSSTRQEWLESRGVRPVWKERSEEASDFDRETAKELRHLKDPLKLADYVRRKLRDDNFEDAQRIIRAASKTLQCVVSWNHLISWQLSKGSLNAALKTYNEMKKRAQFPDGHTYSIIFNGCSNHPQPEMALGKALPIYHSMSSEKSKIKPTVIHVNAILKLCARAMNTEALLAIVAEMPSKGPGSPNNLTYTTLFNALRFFATGTSRSSLTVIQKRQNSEKAILEARSIWVEITKRWVQGELFIDEELVCAFGRLLTLGRRTDVDDVLSLVEQTMNIPRQIPRLGSEARRAVDPRAQITKKSTPVAEAEIRPDNLALEPTSGDQPLETVVIDPFQPIITPSESPGQRRGIFAKPGQNSLSLVLQALLELQLKEPAEKYWHIFTTHHNVQPDQENFHAYLRILRIARASNEAANLVMLKMSVQDLKHTTFRIAMATCRRDKLNRNVFANAGRLLDLMQTAFREPDIPFLEDYLELAITAPAYSKKTSSSGKNDWSKLEQGKQILRALERLNPSLVNLKADLHFADPQLAKKSPAERVAFVDAIHSLTRKMISSYDLLMDKAMVPREFYGPLTKQRSKLSAYVARHKRFKNGREVWKTMDKAKWTAETLAAITNPNAMPSLELFEEDTSVSFSKYQGSLGKQSSEIKKNEKKQLPAGKISERDFEEQQAMA